MGRRKLTADLQRSDSPPYQPGQKVWLSTRDIRLPLPFKKLAHRYVGPFVIQKQINPVTFQLKLPPQYRIHPTFHVSLLKLYHSPVSPSAEPGPITEPPLPLILEDGAVWNTSYHLRVPGKKTIISISFNFLSTSIYVLTILPCLPDY